MSDFRQINEQFLASPQISVGDVAAAKEMGVTMIVNNPDRSRARRLPMRPRRLASNIAPYRLPMRDLARARSMP